MREAFADLCFLFSLLYLLLKFFFSPCQHS